MPCCCCAACLPPGQGHGLTASAAAEPPAWRRAPHGPAPRTCSSCAAPLAPHSTASPPGPCRHTRAERHAHACGGIRLRSHRTRVPRPAHSMPEPRHAGPKAWYQACRDDPHGISGVCALPVRNARKRLSKLPCLATLLMHILLWQDVQWARALPPPPLAHPIRAPPCSPEALARLEEHAEAKVRELELALGALAGQQEVLRLRAQMAAGRSLRACFGGGEGGGGGACW